ncbi:MAG: BrnA antitoxin family protein [Burkholderiales bacterium]|nr:BrnA antitoxin family protein [Burkholderiales bacterium]
MHRLTKRERIAARNRPVTIFLSRDVLAAFKATGKDWPSRINAALKDWLRTHSPT